MIEVCDNEVEIRSVMIDDAEMFERSRNDATSPDAELAGRGIWLKCTSSPGGEVKALCFLRPESPFAIDVHIHIPKKYRGAGTVDIGTEFIRWILINNKGTLIKFNTRIPLMFRDVILYAMKLGFRREGTDRMSIIKDGVVMDMAILGMTFEEARCLHF